MPINTEMLHAQSPDDVAALKARIADLEKENAELKESLYKTEYHKVQGLIEVYGCKTVAEFHETIKDLQCQLVNADKVIAELKAQKAQAEDDCAYWKMSEGNAANAMHDTEEYAMQLYKELCHQKYKRCKNMAQHCYDKWLDTEGRKSGWWRHWQLVWLELAEKFKEGK